MRLRLPAANRGFTIIELLVAMAIFGVIMLVVAIGVVRFANDYYRGVTESKTQAAARSIMTLLTESIQFSRTVLSIPAVAGVNGLCVDNTLYSYKIGQQVTDSPPFGANQGYHGLVVSNPGSCTAATIPMLPPTSALPASSRELLGPHMRMSVLDVTPAGNLYTVHVRVIYGDDNLLNPPISGTPNWATEGCAGVQGSQFCAVSDLTTTVQRRL